VPYLTIGSLDIPRPGSALLKPGGRLVVPLRWRGRTQSVAFVLGEDGLPRSGTVFLCGSIPMVGQDWERCVPLDSGDLVRLYWDADQDISPSRLSGSIAYWPAPGSTRTRRPPAEDVRYGDQRLNRAVPRARAHSGE
jgi:hypothetical protein